jgi:ABC-type oligopeptide transport system substrate-binding subunit
MCTASANFFAFSPGGDHGSEASESDQGCLQCDSGYVEPRGLLLGRRQWRRRQRQFASKAFHSDHAFNLFAAAQPLNDWPVTFRRLLTTSSSANAGHIPLPGGDEVWAALNGPFSDEELRAATRGANQVLVEQLPIVPLYFTSAVFAWDESVAGAQESLSPNGYADFTRHAPNGAA